MTAYEPDCWSEFFLCSIQEKGGSEIQFSGMTEDITGLDFGDKDIESVATANGGRIVKKIPMADESITFKVYPTDAESTSGQGVVQWMHPQDNDGFQSLAADDNTDGILVQNSHGRNKYQVVISWAEDIDDYTTAGTASTADKAAYRITIKNAYMTSYKPSMDDKNLSAEITFKWPPFDKDGASNKKEESTDSTAIPAATSFT